MNKSLMFTHDYKIQAYFIEVQWAFVDSFQQLISKISEEVSQASIAPMWGSIGCPRPAGR